jgi:hypothetical protein
MILIACVEVDVYAVGKCVKTSCRNFLCNKADLRTGMHVPRECTLEILCGSI